MLKLQTPVACGRSAVPVSLEDRVLVMGSCFADRIGEKLLHAGFRACVNPFGTLFNPVSVCNGLRRLSRGIPFTEADCVPMGAGAGRICSFSHHTAFSRETPAAFLANANASLAQASDFYKNCNKVIITVGTSFIYKFIETGEVVANCLKIDPRFFSRERLSAGQTAALLGRLVETEADKQFLFTVSPVRHPGDGAHANQLSKASLLLAVEEVCRAWPGRADYFPAYEIMMDELRDYRFYAPDLVHPSDVAVDYLWERFLEFALPVPEKEAVQANEKRYRQSCHRPLHDASDPGAQWAAS